MSQNAVDALNTTYEEGRPTLISPITAWERGMLAAKGRLSSPVSPYRWFNELIAIEGYELIELSSEILIDSSFLPGELHGDPADRIIIATARAHDLTVVTRDRHILTYAQAGHVRALEC